MNLNCYKIVFSKRLGMLVAVGEHTSSTGKAASGQGCRGSVVADGFVGALRFTFASVALACLSLGNTQAQSSPIASTALPQGGSVSTGSATISTQGAAMAITQSTDKASINWQSFNVGTGASVNIAQPSADAVLLNRVVGNDPSQILGQLKANGQVILLNPNGVLFGKDGSVTASAFTASTFGLSDADFMAGYYKYNRNGSTAAVVNQGTIETSAGGFVALIGATVTNEGTIRAPQGDVVMAAAESVTLPEELVKPQPVTSANTVSVRMSKRVRLEIDPAAINTAVNNTESGVIVTEGGQVLLQAAAISSAVASVTHSGRIDTSAPQAGAVTVLADNGVIKVDGSIKANSSGTDNQGQTRTGGDIIIGRDVETHTLSKVTDVSGATLESVNGFAETSGAYLVVDGIQIKAREWLLDPTDITITTADSGITSAGANPSTKTPTTSGTTASTVNATTLASTLGNGTSVVIRTTNINGSGNGDITVASNVSVTGTGGDATLTLQAERNITLNSNIKIERTGSNKLGVVLNSDFDGNALGAIRLNSGSQILSNGGNITLGGGTVGDGSGYTQGGASYGVALYGATINAGAGNVFIKGQSTSSSGIELGGNNTITAATYDVRGVSSSSSGIYFLNGGNSSPWVYTTNLNSSVGNSVFEGTSTTDRGLFAYSSNSINITSATGSTAAIRSAGGQMRIGYGAGSDINTNGDVTIGSKTNTTTNFFLQGNIRAQSGSLTLLGKSASSNGIELREGNGSSARIIGTNGAQIALDAESGSGVAVNLNAASIGNSITASGSGASISITGVSDTSTGIFTGATNITNTGGSITLNGTSSGSSGLGINNNGGGAFSASGNLTMVGSAVGNNSILLSGSTTSTGGNVSITGTSSTSAALNLQGAITANQNVILSGTDTAAANANSAVYFNKAITATSGTIDITTDTNGIATQALQMGTGASLTTTNQNITLKADSMSVDTTAGAGASINAGTALVSIQNKSSGVSIDLGGSDVGNVTATSRKLGLTNAELGRISSGNLQIGSSTAGNVTVSSAITTNTTTGNISLFTGGNVAVNASLTVGGASATKALTLNATGANSAITQSAAIKSTGLELLGANASYTLTNTGNDIKKIAGNTKLVSLTNNSAFAIDTVNTIGLTTSGNTTFNSTASVTENQKIDTAGLELLGVGGSYTLTNTGNNIRKIAGNTGSVSLTNNSAFAVDTVNTLGLTTTGNTTFRSTAAVTQTQKVAAAGLELLGTGGSYTLTNTSNNVANLAANTGTVSFVDSADLTVGTVNTSGITTTAGDVTLVSNNGVTVAANITSNGNDIAITANGNGGSSKGFEQSAGTINASAGDIAIVGTTKTATGWPNRVGAGLRGNLTGNNIAITGTSDTASAIDGIGVQIEGATSVSAAGTITVAGEVKGGGTGRAVVIGNGPHTPTILSGANGIDIHGTLSSANSGSADNAGVFIDASGVTATSANGAITITGDSSGAGAGYSKNAVVLKYAMNLAAQNGTTIEGTSIGTGASVNIDPEANISITTGALTIQTGGNNASTAFITSGMNARITQNSNAGVTLTTEGQGNITAPKIVNNGTGDVVVAAGKSISAGTATGGQVLTVAGNSIIQNSTGKTYIYSGATDSTGSLNVLTNNFDELYFGGTSHAVNTGFNTAYDGSPVNDLTAPVGGSVSGGAQAFFRSNTKPNFAITLADIHKTYGGADPANQTALNAALLSAYASASGASKLTSTVTSAAGSNTFAVTAADVINTLSGGTARAAGTNVGSYAFTSLSGASTNTTLSTAQLVIDKRDITLDSLTANTKPYDGNTTADIVGASFNNTYNNETLALTGRGYFDSQHVNDVSTVTVTDVTTLTKANGTGAWSNYNLTSTGAHTSSATGKITPVDLTATVNSSGIYVTQAATSARDMGVSYTGFVNGESVSTALTGTATRSYTGAQANPAAGTHANVFGLATTPTANHGNYNIATVVAGDLVVAPADKLFITIDSQNDVYGNRTAANSGKAANNSISAMYCLDGSDCSGSNLVPLTVSRLTDTRWKAADNTGSYVVFDTSIAGTSYSTGGYLNTGNYTFSASEIAPLSLFTNNVANFTGRFSNGGVLTVTALPVQLSTTPVSKAYDGNTTLPSLQLSAANALGGDDLDTSFVSGSYASSAASTAASFSLFGLQLSGVDMSNYTLSNNTYTGIGAITGSSSEKKPFIHPPKPIIPTNNTNSGEAGGGESGGSTAGNPYLLVPNNRNNSADRCTPNTLEDCLCETQEPKPLEGLAICYQPKKTASTRSNNKAKQS